MHEYTFLTMNSTATLTFSTVRDPEEIAAAVQSVFEQYDRRLIRDSLSKVFTSAERGGPRPQTEAAGAPESSVDAEQFASTMTAMALGSAGGFLDAAGVENWALALNGEVLVAGERAANEPWEVTVQDGAEAWERLASVKLVPPRRASKTLRLGKNSRGPRDLVQVTVIADDILAADRATVDVLSGGVQQFSRRASKWTVDAIAIDRTGSVHITGGAFAAVRSGPKD